MIGTGSSRSSLNVRKRTTTVFLLTFVVTALAKGSAFLPGYAIDDYGLVLQTSPPAGVFSQGRFGQAALVYAFHWLGLEAHYARVFFVAFAMVVSALLATLICRHWNVRSPLWLAVAAASMIAVHPFTTEAFTFRTALAIILCAFALLVPLLLPRRWTPAAVVVGAALFVLSLSIYQAVLQYCLMIVLMGAAIGLTRVLVAGSAAGWPPRISSLVFRRRRLRNRNTALLACAVLGATVYVLAIAVAARVLRVATVARFGFISSDRLGERVAAVWRILEYRFWEPSPSLPQMVKRMLLLLLIAALAGLLVRARPWLRRQAFLLLVTVVALLAAALVWTVGVNLVLSTFWPAPRVMSHVGVFWAGTLAIAYRCSGPLTRSALGLLSLLIVLSFIGSDNRILADQLRLNMRDAAKANRVIARLEALPGFTGTEPVALQGTTRNYPLGFGTQDMDMNLSAFSASWSKIHVLREVSGYDLREAQDPQQLAVASDYCRSVEPWPGPQAVALRNRLAILCLGP